MSRRLEIISEKDDDGRVSKYHTVTPTMLQQGFGRWREQTYGQFVLEE
jgi:hypothetical protein